MSSLRARPLRRVRHEVVALVMLSVVPIAIALAFPRDLFSFRALPSGDVSPTCAFVNLTAEEEQAALTAARASWQADSRGARHMRVDLSTGDLPPAPVRPVIATRPPQACPGSVGGYIPESLPPTVAAGAAEEIKPDKAEASSVKNAFTREELLKID